MREGGDLAQRLHEILGAELAGTTAGGGQLREPNVFSHAPSLSRIHHQEHQAHKDIAELLGDLGVLGG
jgi:hypothetical protein